MNVMEKVGLWLGVAIDQLEVLLSPDEMDQAFDVINAALIKYQADPSAPPSRIECSKTALAAIACIRCIRIEAKRSMEERNR